MHKTTCLLIVSLFFFVHTTRANGPAYTNTADKPVNKPLYSPLNGAGRISLFTGTDDILFPNAEKLRGLLVQLGIYSNYYVYRYMINTFRLFKMPEAKRATQQIVQLINN
ncbi:hypothetical protein GA0116948_108153 [Chitinophaga costaii]|uniref:Alpha/beta hydrolase fold n=1 Tax=Chitinophaga costaii TaxID=1335309 RepID=A0A1C4EJ71_9BACT|nr:hypothetical protein [Chitinophaga costaii]PUZ23789.1 hypothetical protein DCM91_13395 [Chitinophaga costaii]SCC43560.1 hypothetical protein GA0116948_108153 [Chitinophaga costaii]